MPGVPNGRLVTAASSAAASPLRPQPTHVAKRTINTTDPDSRPMRRAGRRTVQGDNAHVVASPQQIILAAEVTKAANDSAQLEPVTHHALELAPDHPSAPAGTHTHRSHPSRNSALHHACFHHARAPRPGASGASSTPRTAKRSIADDSRSSSPCSHTPNSFAASTASNAEDWPPARPNGSSSPQHATCSSSGAWRRPRSPPDPARRPPAPTDTSRPWRSPHATNPAGGGVCATASGAGLLLL